MDNILAHIGDTAIINIVSEITGAVQFYEYEESVSGETQTRFLKREIRVSTDEIFWTDWKALTNENLGTITCVSEGRVFIQLRYTRQGTDNTGEIVWSGVNIIGEVISVTQDYPTLIDSIFAPLMDSSDLIRVTNNLFKKLYFRGIIPEYITRAENRDYNEDRDYVDIFKSVARFFALILLFGEEIEKFDENFLREQLNGYGIYIDESDSTEEDLRYLCQNILSQAQQRGTEMIFVKRGEMLPNETIAQINGEFLRLIQYKTYNEFLFEKIPINKIGWNLGNSSPMYRGTAQSYFLNKTLNDDKDIWRHFGIYQTDNGATIYYGFDGEKRVAILQAASGLNNSKVAIGRLPNSSMDISGEEYADWVIPVDSSMSYEITFAFKYPSESGILPLLSLTFGVEGFDLRKRKLSDAFIDTSRLSVSEQFFDRGMQYFVADEWYYCRGIIHSYSAKSQPSSFTTNMGIGKDLIFNNAFTRYIIPRIMVSGSNRRYLYIWDYKIRPLVRGKNIQPLTGESVANSFSLGFIQSSEMTHTYFKNNNGGKSNDEIIKIADKYLYPYNANNLFTKIGNY